MFIYIKFIILAAIPIFLISCTQVKEASHGVGEATGKSVKTIREVPREIKEGYKEGRSGQDTDSDTRDAPTE